MICVSHVEEMELGNGEVVRVEVEERTTGPGTRPVGRGGARMRSTLDDALDELDGMIEVVTERVRTLTSRPDELTLELGISLTTEAGVVIARAASEANLKMTFHWSSGNAA